MKIDTERLIGEVHLRPLLWNKRHALYKNREARDAAWLEISRELFPEYDALNEEEQIETNKKIQQRWRTARDMYKKDTLADNQTSSSSAKKKKKYAYYNIMTFLDGEIYTATDESFYDADFSNTSMLSPIVKVEPLLYTSASPEPSTSTPPQSYQSPLLLEGREKKNVDFENVLLDCFKSNDLKLESEDLAFFLSLQPALKKFTTYQKMLFRTKVMQIIMEMEN